MIATVHMAPVRSAPAKPDVIAAERNLIAAHADIGAARAAFFPTISLNGNVGYASTGLDDLFDGFGLYSFGPQISLPIFDGGARQRNLDITEAQQKIAVAQYEQAIQTAFREAADALAVSSTIDDRVASLERLVEDYAVTMNLSEERFKVGVDDYLSVLDSQRFEYDSRQQLINGRLARALNTVALYRAFGTWPEAPASTEVPAN